MKVLITDYDFPDVELELPLYREACVEVVTAQCRTEDDVIKTAEGCECLLVQYAQARDRLRSAHHRRRLSGVCGTRGQGRIVQAGACGVAAYTAQRRDARHDRCVGVKVNATGQLPGQFCTRRSVNIDHLLKALDANLKGAALDVLPVEPPETDSAIVQHKRVLLSPHAAFYSEIAAKELRRKAAQNLIDWDRNARPSHVVVEGRKKIIGR